MCEAAERDTSAWTTAEFGAGHKDWPRKVVLGDAGLLLLAVVCGGLVLLAIRDGWSTPDRAIPGPRLARLVDATGAASWFPLYGLACWRGVIRRGWNTRSIAIAVVAVLSAVAMTVYAGAPP